MYQFVSFFEIEAGYRCNNKYVSIPPSVLSILNMKQKRKVNKQYQLISFYLFIYLPKSKKKEILNPVLAKSAEKLANTLKRDREFNDMLEKKEIKDVNFDDNLLKNT